MNLDVYVCPCGNDFAVRTGAEPTYCPFCGDLDIEFSHEVEQ